MLRSLVAFAVFLLVSGAARAGSLDQKVTVLIDETARAWLMRSGAPSVSIAVVQDGSHIYAKAYGSARLNPTRPATSQTRYAIHSVSKQFTAAAILLLAEQGKLSLDDKIERWFPDLGAAGQVTIRQILTHTAGIRDFWPQDFLPPEMLHAKAPSAIIAEWATPPIDFEPGSDWHYSNTGYVIAGAIVEKASGEALVPFLRAHVFEPLKMTRVTEDDSGPLPVEDAGGYTRYGTGPIRSAPKEGAGWLFGAGELAMNPSDLARWDISLIDRSLLKPESYETDFTPAVAKDGKNTQYGLGFFIDDDQGRLHISHLGAGSGFHAENHVWPNDKTAIVVLTNGDWTDPSALVDQIAFAILPPAPEVLRARKIFEAYQTGTVDRAQFTDVGNSFLTERVLADLKTSLSALGPARLIALNKEVTRGGTTTRYWKITCRDRRLVATERGYPDGKLDEFMVSEGE